MNVSTVLVRLWRLSALVLIAWLVTRSHARGQADGDLPITPREVAAFLDGADRLGAPDASGTRDVLDFEGVVIGRALRTSPQGDAAIGYAGRSDVLIVLTPDERVAGAALRSSQDTPGHVADVRSDQHFWDAFQDRPYSELGERFRIDAVAGATRTSECILEAVRLRARAKATPRSRWTLRDYGMFVVTLIGLLLGFVRRLRRPVRRVFQVICVGWMGLVLGDLLSLSWFEGLMRSGWTITSPGLVALASAAFLVPWSTGRSIYCAHVCPHGALQEWLGRATPGRAWKVPRWLHRGLRTVPTVLLAFAMIGALTPVDVDLAGFEAFDAWLLGSAATAALVLAVVGLLASAKVGMAYCHYGCPTGELLRFVRAGKPRRADLIAAALLLLAFGLDAMRTEIAELLAEVPPA